MSQITLKGFQDNPNTNMAQKQILNSNYPLPRKPLHGSVPLLMSTTNRFFQSVETMEDEVMLPSKLKDMKIEEFIFDNTNQPDTWHEIYLFVRDTRNQMRLAYPFMGESGETNFSLKQKRRFSYDDEGVAASNSESSLQSATNSTASSDELEQMSSLSTGFSCDAIKDELSYYYYGLIRTLDNLISIANRVTEKYREQSRF